jgi:GNAT superfamily N-acetyltransferase
MTITVQVLSPKQAQSYRDQLAHLLVDSVESGGAVNFVMPIGLGKALQWWDGALESHARGERLILAANSDGRIVGTVQLILALQENQSFRADLAKMLVLSEVRRQGIGAALLQAAEQHARTIGRTLLTLDTRTGEAGERLYARMGWKKVGEILEYATNPDNSGRHGTSLFYKAL